MREILAICYLLTMLTVYVACDEGDVVVNNLPESSDSTVTLMPCPSETVWAPMPCPPETVWVLDPFWECIKKCEDRRGNRMYRDCIEDCLDSIR